LYFDKTTKGKKRFRPEGKVNSKDVAELRKLKSSIISVDAMEREENVGKKVSFAFTLRAMAERARRQ
jgi:hypothetical protein